MFARPTWHLITGEYPEQPGGVSDYTRLVARGLAAAGDDVHIWAPAYHGTSPIDAGVTVHRLSGKFDRRSLRSLGAALNAWPRPSRLFVQYVPQAFGLKGMNVVFARWLMRRQQPVWVMFHEVAIAREPGQSLKHRFLGVVTRLMAKWVAQSAERIFVSIPAWREQLQAITNVNDRVFWLPVPSTLPETVPNINPARQRERFGIPSQTLLIGHFGTYGSMITNRLTPILEVLLARRPECRCLLMGRKSDVYAKNFPEFAGRVHSTGELPAEALSECLRACDLLLQPYPDGVSCRRTSTMAALALGRPIVSNLGALSESLWKSSGAVAFGTGDGVAAWASVVESLIDDEKRRRELGERALRFYAEEFSIDRCIDVLLDRKASKAFPATP